MRQLSAVYILVSASILIRRLTVRGCETRRSFLILQVSGLTSNAEHLNLADAAIVGVADESCRPIHGITVKVNQASIGHSYAYQSQPFQTVKQAENDYLNWCKRGAALV